MPIWNSISPVTRFVILFLLMLLLVSIVFSQLFTRFHDNMTWLMRMTTSISGWVLCLFAADASYSGVLIHYRNFSLEIIDECTGLFEMLIFFAAVLSYPTGFRKKLTGFALGIPAIFVFNLIRIIFLMIAGAYSVRLFDFMHLYLWQATLIIMIASIWVGWLYLVVYRVKGAPTRIESGPRA